MTTDEKSMRWDCDEKHFVAIDAHVFHGSQVFDWVECLEPRVYATTVRLRIVTPYIPFESDYGPCIRRGLIEIPPGWVFDGASGPAIDGVGNMLASLIHDYLYFVLSSGCHKGGPKITYALADCIYYDVMRAQGGGAIRTWGHWLTLRTFGWMWRLFN